MKKMIRLDMYVGQTMIVNNFHGRIARVEPKNGTNDTIEFWHEVVEGGRDRKTMFKVFGTGHSIPDGWHWCGTTSRSDGRFVWHLYEQAVK